MIKQLILDIGQDSPKTLSAQSMSDELARELVKTLYMMDLPDDNDWREEWLIKQMRTINHKFFTLKERQVVYDLAFKYQLLS